LTWPMACNCASPSAAEMGAPGLADAGGSPLALRRRSFLEAGLVLKDFRGTDFDADIFDLVFGISFGAKKLGPKTSLKICLVTVMASSDETESSILVCRENGQGLSQKPALLGTHSAPIR
jgi:hypothetical protein